MKDQDLNLQELSEQFKNLRQQPSHYDTNNQGEFNAQVDQFDGEKHQVMQKLGDALGKEGTKWEAVLETMGEPDEITRDINNPFQSPSFMPGPIVPNAPAGSEQEGLVYLVYHWRGRHDFLYFTMDESTETIKSSAWYQAGE